MNCPTCDMPMIWSDSRERMWCSIYGDHREQHEPRHRTGFPIKFIKRSRDAA